MHDDESNTLTEDELAQIHGGGSHIDAQGRVHSGDGGFPDSITMPDGTVLPLLPLSAPAPQPVASKPLPAISLVFLGAVRS